MLALIKHFSVKQNLSRVYQKIQPIDIRNYGVKSKRMKVAILGAAGTTGQLLSLMLKQSPLIEELAITDVRGTDGIAKELAHIDTNCRMSSAKAMDGLRCVLEDAKVVVLVAAAPQIQNKSPNHLFEANALICKDLAEQCAVFCPHALFAIATNPVNSLVPLFSEVMKKNGAYDPHKIFGVTTLNVVRANTFVAEILGLEPECVIVPVVGGNSGLTIVPLLSHAKPVAEFTLQELENITKNLQNAEATLSVLKKNEKATLSNAFAIARFVLSLIKGLHGQPNIVECAFVKTLQYENTKYFSSPIQLGQTGMQKNLGVPEVLTDYELCLIDKALKLVSEDIKKGELYVGVEDPPICDPCSPDIRAPLCPPDWCERRQSRKLED